MEAASTAVHDRPARPSPAAAALDRILPKTLDNRYRGHAVAVWLLGLLVFVKAMISLVSLVDPAPGYKADGIPLGAYPAGAARAVVGVGAYLDVELLILVLVFVVVLVRYRAAVPLMYLLLVVEFLAHKWAGLRFPIVRAGGGPQSVVTFVMFALMLIGLGLALTGKGYSAPVKPK
ncbi:MAG: hypothetical protein JO111_14010 [Caulobacteraceae bacterium]|nr:hypothetical protein [Caulobacteraceae bacterium]